MHAPTTHILSPAEAKLLCYFKLFSNIFVIKFLLFSLLQTILKYFQKKLFKKKNKKI